MKTEPAFTEEMYDFLVRSMFADLALVPVVEGARRVAEFVLPYPDLEKKEAELLADKLFRHPIDHCLGKESDVVVVLGRLHSSYMYSIIVAENQSTLDELHAAATPSSLSEEGDVDRWVYTTGALFGYSQQSMDAYLQLYKRRGRWGPAPSTLVDPEWVSLKK